MATKKTRSEARLIRKTRVRKQIKGTGEKPRLCVYRSLKFTYVQLISDETGTVVLSCDSKQTIVGEKSAKSVESAKALGMKVAELAKGKNIENVVFDRNGYLYHGRVKAVADGAREGGLKF